MNFSPLMYVVAARAKQRGASAADIAPLLFPLSGNAGLMLTAMSTLRNQDRLDALGTEIRTMVNDPVKIAELEKSSTYPQTAKILTRSGVQPQLEARDQAIVTAMANAVQAVLDKQKHAK
ncbi:MAG: hypothetical protein ACLGG2_02825 [Gammaproteobacteria bacterium]